MSIERSRGSVLHVLGFSLPVIVSQACDSLMMFTDRYMLAQIDPLLAAASMSGGMTAFLFWIFGTGLLGFITSLVSQCMGAKQPEMAKAVIPQSLICAILLAIPLLIFGPSLAHIYFTFLKLPQEELPLAMSYFAVIIQGCFFVFVKVAFASFFSGIGTTKVVMLVNLLGLFLNVPLSYFFMHGGLGEQWMGVRGAALGTVLAEIIMTAIYFFIFLRKHGKDLKWSYNPIIFKKLLKYGVPTGFEFFFLTFAFNSFLTMFHSFGIYTAQAITVATNWSWLVILPFFGLNVGVSSLVGHALGARDPDMATKITRSALKIAFGIVAIASIGFLGLTESMIKIFGIEQSSLAFDLANFMVLTLPLYCLFDAIEFVLTGTLRASGDTRFCLKVSAIGHWTCLVVCFYGVYFGSFSPRTIWSLFIVNLFTQASIDGYRYLQGSWRSLNVLR